MSHLPKFSAVVDPVHLGLQTALKALYPPATVWHIGAGLGQGDLHLWRQWGIEHAWLIDADETRLAWANAAAADQPGWRVLAATLSGSDGAADYYRTSNPDEDGLLNPADLAGLWPNLRLLEKAAHPTQTLDTLLAQSREACEAAWLVVDCLPALDILQGARQALAGMSVVCARVAHHQDAVPGADESAIADHLEPLGFKRLGFVPGNHPQLGHAYFARDLNSALGQLDAQGGAQTERLKESEQQRVELATQLFLQKTTLEQLTVDREKQAKIAAERQQQLDALGQRIAALEQERDAQTRLADERLQQVDHALTRIHALESENQNVEHRQHLMQEELIKAEAQIELIKDLLLREPGL